MPDNLSEMIDVAEKLSSGFKFLRVDLYNVKVKYILVNRPSILLQVWAHLCLKNGMRR